jgi:RNA polymerase sigma factor (sigma-70 family)
MVGDDAELVAAWVAGRAGAEEALARLHYASVLRFFELKYPSEADDLAQQVFLAAHSARERYTGEGSFRSYLLGIARIKLLERLRQAEKTSRLVRFGDEDDGASRTRLSTLVARRQEHELVLVAMAALPVEKVMPLQLYYWENLSTLEIAQVLGVPKSTVTSRLARARDALKTQIRALTRPGPMQQQTLGEVERWARELSQREGSDA